MNLLQLATRLSVAVLLSLLLTGCDNQKQDNAEHLDSLVVDEQVTSTIDTLAKFRKFLAKFKMLQYPILLNTSCLSTEWTEFDAGNDSIFVDWQQHHPYGILPDTQNFFATICTLPTNCELPVLLVYTKKGRLIDQEVLADGCTTKPCFECVEHLNIQSNHQIVSYDSLKTFECDAKSNKGKMRLETQTTSFRIEKNGEITESLTLIED